MKRAIRFVTVQLVATTMFAQSSKNANAPTASVVVFGTLDASTAFMRSQGRYPTAASKPVCAQARLW
jgi:hypothetical protein